MIDYIRAYVPKQPVFTRGQLLRLANILDNAGQVIFGIVVVTPIVTGFDSRNFPMLVWGLAGVITCWLLSILLSQKA